MPKNIKLVFKLLVLTLLTLVVIMLIHKVTLYLYFDNKALSIQQAFLGLWSQGELYYAFMAVLNYILKPILFYIFGWILWSACEKDS